MNNLLEYKGYLGSVEYSASNEIFYGRIIGIDDRITYDGDSVQGLKNSFVEAVEDYLEGCAEIGKEPEKSYAGSLNVHVTPELHRKAIGFSMLNNRTLDETVEEALRQLVG